MCTGYNDPTDKLHQVVHFGVSRLLPFMKKSANKSNGYSRLVLSRADLTASARTSSQSPDFFQGFFFCGSLNMPFRISRPWLTGNPVWHLTGKLFPRTFPPACFSPSGLTSGQASASDCPPPLRDSWRHRQSQKRGKKPPAEQPCVTRTIRIAGEAAGAPGSGRFPAYPGHSC